MNTTVLIHEVYLRLADGEKTDFQNRTHFYATASKAMRQVLVNYAERQGAAKRGAGALMVAFDDTVLTAQTSAEEMLGIHELLTELEAESPRRARVIECRVFGGMTIDEVAEALSVSPATVKREWRLGTVSLYRKLNPPDSDS